MTKPQSQLRVLLKEGEMCPSGGSIGVSEREERGDSEGKNAEWGKEGGREEWWKRRRVIPGTEGGGEGG